MKLVEILARELNEWPFSASGCVQDADGSMDVKFYSDQIRSLEIDSRDIWIGYGWGMEHWVNPGVEAEDAKTAKVTRTQWEAERERLAGIKEQDTVHHGEAIMPSSSDSPRYEQELWDKVALGAMIANMNQPQAIGNVTVEEFIEWGIEVADAFIVERSKRLNCDVK